MPRNNKKIEYAIELIENEIKAVEGCVHLNIHSHEYDKAFGNHRYRDGLVRALSFIKPVVASKQELTHV